MRGQILRRRESRTGGVMWFECWKVEDEELYHVRYGYRTDDKQWDVVVEINEEMIYESDRAEIWWGKDQKEEMENITRDAFENIIGDIREYRRKI